MLNESDTFTAEHRSWAREIVLQFEEGSLPASSWNEPTLNVVATWYAANLDPALAASRYELYFQRNRNRLMHRLGNTPVDTSAIESLDSVGQGLIARVLAATRPPQT